VRPCLDRVWKPVAIIVAQFAANEKYLPIPVSLRAQTASAVVLAVKTEFL